MTATDEPMERFLLDSLSPTESRVEALREHFPEAFGEEELDIESLANSLGEWVEPGSERFGLHWPGKAACSQTVQQPSIGTLAPMPEQSVDWDATENVIVEGDNLEVLKLLQRSYHAKLKLVYIDPPYNTGKEFIYPDNFKEGLSDYLRFSGQVGEGGFKLTANAETNGRYHSKWLSMMYPRLFLARNLLRDDGFLFASIDDHEHANLRLLLDEIFGPENFVGVIANVNNPKGRSDQKNVARAHEYLIVYRRSLAGSLLGFEPGPQIVRRYREADHEGRQFRYLDLRKTGDNDRREDRPHLYYGFHLSEEGELTIHNDDHPRPEGTLIYPTRGDGSEGNWRWQRSTAAAQMERLEARRLVQRDGWSVFERDYLDSRDRVTTTSAWTFKDVNSERGSEQLANLGFSKEDFPRPKPLGLLRRIVELSTDPGDLVLDFFAGSGVTGEAVLRMNAESGLNRRFILVQLPEPLESDDFENIAQITRARVRRSADAVRREATTIGAETADLGFRAYRLEPSCFETWDSTSSEVTLLSDGLVGSPSEDRVIAELLLKSGFELTEPVVSLGMESVAVHSVVGGQLLIVSDGQLTLDAIESMAEKGPSLILVLDRCFGDDDELKVNTMQTIRAANQGAGANITLKVV